MTRLLVRVLSGARTGAEFSFAPPSLIRIGRRPDNQIQLDVEQDLDVSGHHGELRWEAEGLFFYDVGSANGSFVQGARIERLRIEGPTEVTLGARGPRLSLALQEVVRQPPAAGPGPDASPSPVRTTSAELEQIEEPGAGAERKVGAGTAILRLLESGDVMFTYGFPGRLARVHSPNATLVQGIIGRLTQLDGNHGSFPTNKLIQHSAFTSGGTSGSPIFDQAGRVIAINAGSYVEAGTLRVLDPVTGKQKKMRVAKQLSGYNFGIRVDVLVDLMKRL